MAYANSGGVRIYYEISGEGFPFLWVHANPFDHNLLMYQVAHLSTYFKVISLDIRGYGRSDKPTHAFGLKDMADDVLAVCCEAQVQEAIIGGVSVGSGIALLLGLDYPERWKAVILVGGSSGGGERIEDRIEAEVQEIVCSVAEHSALFASASDS